MSTEAKNTWGKNLKNLPKIGLPELASEKFEYYFAMYRFSLGLETLKVPNLTVEVTHDFKKPVRIAYSVNGEVQAGITWPVGIDMCEQIKNSAIIQALLGNPTELSFNTPGEVDLDGRYLKL